MSSFIVGFICGGVSLYLLTWFLFSLPVKTMPEKWFRKGSNV